MTYCAGTPNSRGYLIKLTVEWDGSPNFEFKIEGRPLDSNLVKDLNRH